MFLLPGAMIGISEYNNIRNVILQKNYLVISLYMNVLWPIRDNHRKHAKNVKKVFDGLKSLYKQELSKIDMYTIIAHSVGGKVGLLVASIIDSRRVSSVLALDPVDINSVEFTNKRGSNLSLPSNSGDNEKDSTSLGIAITATCSDEKAALEDDFVHIDSKEQSDMNTTTNIVLTCTDGGRGIPKAHNAHSIHILHPATTYYHHKHAGHMAYCDNGGGSWAGKLMPDIGTSEGNDKARESTYELIRQILD